MWYNITSRTPSSNRPRKRKEMHNYLPCLHQNLRTFIANGKHRQTKLRETSITNTLNKDTTVPQTSYVHFIHIPPTHIVTYHVALVLARMVLLRLQCKKAPLFSGFSCLNAVSYGMAGRSMNPGFQAPCLLAVPFYFH